MFSRRQFLTRTFTAASLAAMPHVALAQSRPPLKIPPLIEVGRGRPIRLDFRAAQTQFNTGKLVDVWGVNGQYLAPTVRVKSGDFVKLIYTNNLPQPLSINIQGLLAPTDMVGSIHRQIAPNGSWSPILSINQPACSGWYHANTMLNSAFQVYRGLVGFWLIEDNESRQLPLPNRYGINDIPLILQDQLINSQGVQLLDAQAAQFFGKRLFVNGQESPYLNVPRGWVRLRLVNASLSRVYDLRLDNGKPLYVIATGLGTLAEPVETQSLRLVPSERAEILIDLNEGDTVSLLTGEKRDFLYKIEQLFTNNNDLEDNVVLELRPEGLPSAFNTAPQLPAFNPEAFKLNVMRERTIKLRPLDRLINQQRFDPKRIDFDVKLGSVERWIISSVDSIGFTLQGAKFVLETELQPESSANPVWRDSLWLEKDKAVSILVRFEHSASAQQPFTFGVSDLMLKDRGCMGQFTVT